MRTFLLSFSCSLFSRLGTCSWCVKGCVGTEVSAFSSAATWAKLVRANNE